MTSLLELLGYPPEAKVLIVSCDELGFCQAGNSATYEVLRGGNATSASLMIPAPWARAAAADHRGEDVGVHLTINSELDCYRWGPITQAPSLLDGDGAFPRTIDDVWEHADLDEVRREWRAQIERAVLWGFNVTHLDTHLGGVELKPEFFDVYLDLADDFRLPVRLPGVEEERRVGFPFRALADERGVLAPDRVIQLTQLGKDADEIRSALGDLPPGVTEVFGRPAFDTAELRGAVPEWRERVDTYALLSSMQGWENTGTHLAGYRQLRQLMA